MKLTPVEYKLLYHLVRNAGRVMPHQALLDRVWGDGHSARPGLPQGVHQPAAGQARAEDGPRLIETERGLGYRFIRLKTPMQHTTPPTTTTPNAGPPDTVQS